MMSAPERPVEVPSGPLIEVDAPGDPRLDPYRDLNDPARRVRLDAEQSVFVVEGNLAVDRLLTSPYAVCSLLVDDHHVVAASDVVTAVRRRGAAVFVGSRAVVTATVGFDFHRGMVAVARRPVPLDAATLLADVAATRRRGGVPLVAVLEGLNDHENIGALFRNAAAFAVAGVLLDPTCADPLYRRSVRVSVGHVLHIPFSRLAPWPARLDDVRAAGFVVAALTPRPPTRSGVPITTFAELATLGSTHHRGIALLFGAEGPGLSDAALGACDVLVPIPMAIGVDSLNVATAAAIAFHTLAGP
jgi:tRNA G18 (ribose-2'-O)-methylase SpoU